MSDENDLEVYRIDGYSSSGYARTGFGLITPQQKEPKQYESLGELANAIIEKQRSWLDDPTRPKPQQPTYSNFKGQKVIIYTLSNAAGVRKGLDDLELTKLTLEITRQLRFAEEAKRRHK